MDTATRRDFLAGVGAGAISLVFAAPVSAEPTLDGLRDGWRQPPRSCRPHIRWWWPGGAVIFLSDNGGPTGELTSSNAPLRGFKGQLWEGGVRGS